MIPTKFGEIRAFSILTYPELDKQTIMRKLGLSQSDLEQGIDDLQKYVEKEVLNKMNDRQKMQLLYTISSKNEALHT